MAILLFSIDYPPLIGGIATYSYHVARSLSAQEKVVVLAPWMKKARVFDRQQRFKTFRIPNVWGLRELLFFFSMIYCIRHYRIKYIFNAMWFPCGAISFLVTRMFGIPYFVSTYAAEMLDDATSLRRRFKKRLHWLKEATFNNARKIFSISNYTKERLMELKVPSEKIAVVPAGVDIERFKSGIWYNDLQNRYNLKSKKVLLTVARLDEYKGHDMVIRALADVLDKFSNTVYLIVGQGTYERRLRQLVIDLDLEDNVIFVGSVPDEELVNFYNACDIFVMPSREIDGRKDMIEGYGISYLEANACGKPVIGGKSGGVEDAVVHGKTGLLVNPLNVKELTEAISRLLTDERLAEELGHAGQRRTEEELNWPRIAAQLKELMEDKR